MIQPDHPKPRMESQPESESEPMSGSGSEPRRADPLLAAIVRTMPAPLVVLDEELVVVVANAALLEVWAVSSEEVVGRSLFGVAEGRLDVPPLRTLLHRILREQRPLEKFELRTNAGVGGSRVFLLDGRRLEAGRADPPRILLSFEDVTDRYRLERQARTYARELERSNRELEDFAHAASHDLQEPLRKIRMYAERLPGMLDPGALGERAERYLTRLTEAAERLQDRIDALLQLARVGRAAPQPVRVDLDRLVRDVLDDVGMAIAETGAELHVGRLGELEADPVQVRLLFQNLLSNSLKFHEAGRTPVIRISAEPGGPLRTFVVEDEGIGFEQEYAERIFGPFQRLHGRTEYAGSGVGLSLCRRIVEHHGGSIRAEGRPGSGARFIITLPARQTKESPMNEGVAL